MLFTSILTWIRGKRCYCIQQQQQQQQQQPKDVGSALRNSFCFVGIRIVASSREDVILKLTSAKLTRCSDSLAINVRRCASGVTSAMGTGRTFITPTRTVRDTAAAGATHACP